MVNSHILCKFTPQILQGVESLGLNSRQLLGVNKDDLDLLAFGIEELTARQARILEKKSGRSVGELSVLGIASSASPAKRARHAKLIEGTLEMLAHSRSTSPAPRRAVSARHHKAPTTSKRSRGTRARAA